MKAANCSAVQRSYKSAIHEAETEELLKLLRNKVVDFISMAINCTLITTTKL